MVGSSTGSGVSSPGRRQALFIPRTYREGESISVTLLLALGASRI